MHIVVCARTLQIRVSVGPMNNSPAAETGLSVWIRLAQMLLCEEVHPRVKSNEIATPLFMPPHVNAPVLEHHLRSHNSNTMKFHRIAPKNDVGSERCSSTNLLKVSGLKIPRCKVCELNTRSIIMSLSRLSVRSHTGTGRPNPCFVLRRISNGRRLA